MTTKEEFEKLKYIMFGIIVGGAFSFFGSVAVGAFFADPNAEGKMFLFNYATAFVVIFLVIFAIIFFYSLIKSK